MSRNGPRRTASKPSAAPALTARTDGPSKQEMLQKLQIDTSRDSSSAGNKAKKSFLSAPSTNNTALVQPAPTGALYVHGDATGVEYRSKAYWSNTSANIEELLLPLMDKHNSSSSSGSCSSSSARALGKSLVPLNAALLPEWQSIALLGREPGGLYAGMAVCDTVLAYSDIDGAAEVLNAVHQHQHSSAPSGVCQ